MAWTQTELVESLAYYEDRPVYFVQDFFGADPDEWQGQALEKLADCSRRRGANSKYGVAARSGHGVGKTTDEAWAILWFLVTRPHPKVPCLAPTEHQLTDILWPEIALWMEKAKQRGNPLPLKWTEDRVYMEGHKKTWFAVARTGGTPEAAAGFHQEDLLFVIDEASGVRDQIMVVMEGALTTEGAIAFMCGNPTKAQGYFMDAFGRNRKRWHTFTISGENSPRVKAEWVRSMIEQWGYDSDVVRVRVRGLPPKGDANQFILLDWVERATTTKITPSGMLLTMGVDVARYGDSETVITPRWGNAAYTQHCYKSRGVDEVAGLTLRHAREAMDFSKVPRISIRVDDSGVGGGVTDLLKAAARDDKRLQIVACNFGGPGNDDYVNATGVMYGKLRELMRYDEMLTLTAGGTIDPGRPPKETEISIPNDDELIGQLVSRKYTVDKKGKIRLETKEEMRERKLKSPDRADSLALAFYDPPGEIAPHIRDLLRGASFSV